MVTAASLADWVTSALIASSTFIVAPCFKPELGRRLDLGVRRHDEV